MSCQMSQRRWVLQTALVLQVVVEAAPAFHVFYATGWQHATMHYRLVLPGQHMPQVSMLFALAAKPLKTKTPADWHRLARTPAQHIVLQ